MQDKLKQGYDICKTLPFYHFLAQAEKTGQSKSWHLASPLVLRWMISLGLFTISF